MKPPETMRAVSRGRRGAARRTLMLDAGTDLARLYGAPAWEDNRCLLVDDDVLLLSYLSVIFRSRGYEVETATSGAAALRAVRERPPAFVLLDVGIPDVDGVQVLTAIRTIDSTRDIPVIMLTARKDDASVIRALEQGADDYITKPVLPHTLVARVREVLDTRAH
jgi:DNA-binding response OmpR family regulator